MGAGKRLKKFLAVAAFAGAALLGGWQLTPALRAEPPQPKTAPTAWELTFRYQPPERIYVAPAPGKEPQAYWFVRYTVINNTGRDLLFTPRFELMTDEGPLHASETALPAAVFQKIKEFTNAPFLESPVRVLGRLLQGDDNAREGVAVFTNLPPSVRKFRLFVTGLSGEFTKTPNPAGGEDITLQKTLVLDYDLAGESVGITIHPQFKGESWVMR